MRVMWLKSDYVDPPETGGKIRTYNLLRELRKRCEVTYISLTSNHDLPNGERKNSKECWVSEIATYFRPEEKKWGAEFYMRLLGRMFSLRPYIVQKYLCQQIREFQRRLLAQLANGKAASKDQTVLICDFLEMAGNVVWSAPWPKILFQHNVESVIWRRHYENETNWLKRAYFWFEFQRLRRYERSVCNRFDLVLAVSERDKETFRAMGVTKPIEVIETGVDVEFFTPQQDVKSIPGRLLFLGSLDWMPNIDGLRWFVEDIYSRIKKACPHATLDIVGRRPTPTIVSLQRNENSIRVVGDVPDVRPYIAAADIFVVPLRVGSGTRLKIFEAMAMDRPVVSTTIGAEGLPLTHEKDLLLADSSETFAEQVAQLLSEPNKKKTISETGHRMVTDNYSWETVSEKLFEVCRSIQEVHS
jgi:glycosyltransferase involved in cell wall biosynthesis